MKRICVLTIASFLISTAGISQKGNNTIGGGGDLCFPTGQFGDFFKTGFGVYGKTMLGIGKAGQMTFTSGYSSFKLSENLPGATVTFSLIPLLVGYRHNFNGVFIEPQLGYSIVGAKTISEEEGSMTDADGFFTAAANIGYVFNRQVEVSLRYQAGGKNGSDVHLLGLRLGYNFSLGSSKK